MINNHNKSDQTKTEQYSIDEIKKLDITGLQRASENIRNYLIESISSTGGHIGANLGTIELSMALHYVFDSPNDVFIFDTGHTGYTHKILTGRGKDFKTLNTYGGMSRFISRDESEHDFIETSHAGTSISLAIGRAITLRNSGSENWTVALIGDGAIAEGIALEAINHAAVEKNLKLIIIINDNGYAISPGYGGIHEYLQSRKIGKEENSDLFELLGYKAKGPIDGHSCEALVSELNGIKKKKGTYLLHVKTIKGKGFEAAQNHEYRMHFSFPYNSKTGELKEKKSKRPTYQDIAARTINICMRKNKKINVITPSTLYATGLSETFKEYKQRCFDPGMVEQHAVSMAVGMARAGDLPILFYQSTFLQRAFDQLIHDVSFANEHIVILTVRTGFAGYDNPTHHGIYDISYMRCLPNTEIYYPKDSEELHNILLMAIEDKKNPTIIHMPYGTCEEVKSMEYRKEDYDKPEVLIEGDDGVIMAVGNKVDESMNAAIKLREQGIRFGVINVRRIKPINQKCLKEMIKDIKKLVTVEENVLEGGFGAAVSSMLHEQCMNAELLNIGLPCKFIEPGSNEELSRIYELDASGIENKIRKRWY